MDLSKWLWIYHQIASELGYDPERDRRAAQILSQLLNSKPIPDLRFLEDSAVVICGNSPQLESQLRSNPIPPQELIIAADGATSVLLKLGYFPELIVTDLDGFIPDLIYANRLGSIAVVHAHGDNIPLLIKVVPELIKVLGTTQLEPIPPRVLNFGGLTDGDRCVFLAKHFGARSIRILGIDLELSSIPRDRIPKFSWGLKLIQMVLRGELD